MAMATEMTATEMAVQLGELIGAFKACLETQDTEIIRQHREQLLAAVQRFQTH